MNATAAREYPPITIKRLTLHNIKCFRHVTLTFDRGSESRPWTLLVGDNGVGKTTVLQCIALCALGPELANKMFRRPENMLRAGSEKGYMEAVFDASLEAVEESSDVVIRIEIEKGKRTFSTPLKKKDTLEKKNRLHLLGAKALRDFPASRRDPGIVSLARDRMYRLMESGADVKVRFEAAELVGQLGDTRIRPDNMVPVPEGEFTRGSEEGENNEKPERRIFLDAYEIGAYAVTNQEFKGFVEAGGYDTEEYWTAEGWKWRLGESISEPRYWFDRQWNGANFPVVGVSWYEAAAYAQWLSKETGENYRLPTEAQWEKAARGADGRTYPWGNEFDKDLCNSIELGLGRISPVGLFPGGRSGYGCFDMAGNAWEWCADGYDGSYYKDSPAKNPKGPAGGSNRVIRGGSWGLGARYCRAACRDWYRPGSWWGDGGFRLVRLSF